MQGIERAFAVLRAVRTSEGSAGVSEIARATGLPKSTVSRLLTSLEEVGALDRVDASGGYVIGPGISTLAGGGTTVATLRQVSRPYLRELTDDLGESSGLTIPDGDTALFVDHLPTEGSVRTRDWTGMRFPYHTVAGGLAILMTWSDLALGHLAGEGLESFTTRTITTKTALRSRLTKARRDGYVWTMGDFDLEINGVAAPIIDGDGKAVAAISVYGPSYRFPGQQAPVELGERLAATSRLIGQQLQG